jgi:hypothetical protein
MVGANFTACALNLAPGNSLTGTGKKASRNQRVYELQKRVYEPEA